MNKAGLKICAGLMLALAGGSVAFGQVTTTTTKTEVVQNADGSYTVIEYPVGKEVMVNLLPGTAVAGSKGNIRVMRTDTGSKVWVDVSGVPADVSSYYAYAVDPSGVPTLLGPVAFNNGVANSEFSTPMNQFMVVLSPNEGLTTIDSDTAWVYRSELPAGYTVVPRRGGGTNIVAVPNTVVSVPTTRTVVAIPNTNTVVAIPNTNTVVAIPDTVMASGYEVPLLNVPSFGEKKREVKLRFGGELSELEAIANIERRRGATKVKMRFDDLTKVPANKRFILWASSADGKYTKLGQVVSTGRKDKATIQSETALNDFGLFLTVEDNDVLIPTSRIYSVFGVPTL